MRLPNSLVVFTKIKLQMNEHEISSHVKYNSRLQIVQPEFTT